MGLLGSLVQGQQQGQQAQGQQPRGQAQGQPVQQPARGGGPLSAVAAQQAASPVLSFVQESMLEGLDRLPSFPIGFNGSAIANSAKVARSKKNNRPFCVFEFATFENGALSRYKHYIDLSDRRSSGQVNYGMREVYTVLEALNGEKFVGDGQQRSQAAEALLADVAGCECRVHVTAKDVAGKAYPEVRFYTEPARGDRATNRQWLESQGLMSESA